MIILLNFTCTHISQKEVLKSPSGKLTCEILADENDNIFYKVRYNETEIINPSRVGIIVDQDTINKIIEIHDPILKSVRDSYETRGNHTHALNHFHSKTFSMITSDSSLKVNLECRIYDDGFAYRYLIENDVETTINGELSAWNILPSSEIWFFERPNAWKLKSYAGEWMKTEIEKLPHISPGGPIQGTPLVIELPRKRGYMLISEANLSNYSGMRLKAIGNNKVQANFTEENEGFVLARNAQTPWRLVLFATNLNELVNSDLITNLNPAPDSILFDSADWIVPGKSVWRWWSKGTGNPEEEKVYVDFANELNFEYTIIDAGWENWSNKWMCISDLCQYAETKGVGVWVWKHSQEISDSTNNWSAMRNFFDNVKKSGAKGIKIDYMNSEDIKSIDFEITVLKEAARRQLMINFHGCHQSSGEYRTYPNEMTREGIRGLELNSMKEGPIPAWHNAALPFTRFAVGHADYTPLGLTAPGPTTWTHQLATLVCFLSPLQVIAEDAEFLLTDKTVEPALPFIRSIPTVWDETIVLPVSKIGECAAIARRKENDWYLGVLNSDKERTFQLALDFLNRNEFNVELYSDDLDADKISLQSLNPKAKLKEYTKAVPFIFREQTVHPQDILEIEMAKGGGFVAKFTEITESID